MSPVVGAPVDFYVLGWGLVAASVCTSLPLDAATERLNLELPTGISSRWAPAADPTFASGQANPSDCPDIQGARPLPVRMLTPHGDACDRCSGKGIVPTVPGDFRVMVPCRKCAGTGRRGGGR